MKNFTIFGGNGFVGSEIVCQLKKMGHKCYVPKRDDENIYKNNLGYVIYASGNGSCSDEPFSVLNANTIQLSKLLRFGIFSKLIYISSTRLYMNIGSSNEYEDLKICNEDSRRLFNLTKLVSEEMCLLSKKNIQIVRPSNIYGLALDSPLFLPSIVRNAIQYKKVDMHVPREYSKDYISVTDVATLCIKLAQNQVNHPRIINLASGSNISAHEIADILEKNISCEIFWHESKVEIEKFPKISIYQLKKIFPDFFPKQLKLDLEKMIEQFKRAI
jgi:nucleoside-diphosphate-sugar epimerase